MRSKRRSMTYTQLAAVRFLDGLPYRSPVSAIEAGARSIQEWCDVLAETRREHAGHLGTALSVHESPRDASPDDV